MVRDISLSSLIVDEAFYPRTGIDDTHVSDLVRALKSGAELPPIVANKRTLVVIDGVHRLNALRRHLGDGDEVMVRVELRAYKDDAEAFLDAVALNSQHGKKLDRQDQARIVLRLRELNVPDQTISVTLHVPQQQIDQLAVRIVISPSGEAIPAKRGIPPMLFGKPMTAEQIEAMRHVRSAEAGRLCQELYSLLKNDLVDRTNANVLAKMRILQDAINDFLRKEVAA